MNNNEIDEIIEDRDEKELSENSNKKIEKKESAAMEWIKSIIIALALALIIKSFIIEPTKIQGNSMTDTLHDSDRVIVNKIVMKMRALKRGDIIVMKFDKDHDYIKRIVGLPGDYIQLIDGKVYINGEQFHEDYINGDYTEIINGYEWKLKEDEYFVMGDNRNPGGSTDSRVFGPVNLEQIKGVASFRFYPFDGRIGLIK